MAHRPFKNMIKQELTAYNLSISVGTLKVFGDMFKKVYGVKIVVLSIEFVI